MNRNKTCMTKRLLHAIVGPVVAGLGTADVSRGDPICPFLLETDTWYLQIGMEVNPAGGVHDFLYEICPPPPSPTLWEIQFYNPSCWCFPPLPPPPEYIWPTRMIYTPFLSLVAQGTSRHISMPHATDIVTFPPCPPTVIPDCWTFNIGANLGGGTPLGPGTWGARERRITGMRNHPAGHGDKYAAVVGALAGTAPGPSIAPRFVILHGSMGRHEAPAPPTRAYGCRLEPPSGQPSVPNQDYPAGQMIMLVNELTLTATVLLCIDSVPVAAVTQVQLRDGPAGPVLTDLRPEMQSHAFFSHTSALTAGDADVAPAMPQLQSGQAYMVVPVPVSTHPDGKILGKVQRIYAPGDMNCDDLLDQDDVPHLVNALVNPNSFSGCDVTLADTNGDGHQDGQDVQKFADDLTDQQNP